MSFVPEKYSFFTLSEEKLAYWLVPVWLLMQILLFFWYDIRIVYDSHRYFAYAESLVNGTDYWHVNSAKFYTAYTFLLGLLLYLVKLPVSSIILLQVIVSGTAALFLYKGTIIASGSRKAAVLATLFFILWPDLQFWNLYIHTESLYISLSVISLYFLLVARQMQQYISLALLLTILCSLRPNGLFVTIAVAVALLFKNRLAFYFRGRYSVAVVTVALLFILVTVAVLSLEVFSPIGYYSAGQLIQGYNGYTSPIALPATEDNQPVIRQLFEMMLANPLTFLKLLAGRFLIFWAQVRPYYSAVHNITILLFFLPLYYFAAVYISRVKASLVTVFILTLAVLHTIMVTVIAVDWDNRFIVPLLPFVFILAASGIIQKAKSCGIS